MAGLRSTKETIVRNIQYVCHLKEIRRHFVREGARLHAPAARGLDHLEAVLVGARLEEDVAALTALEARDRVGGDHLIGMADVRPPVGIMDRGGEVIGLGHAGALGGHVRRFNPHRAGASRAISPLISNTVAPASSERPTAAPASSRAA